MKATHPPSLIPHPGVPWASAMPTSQVLGSARNCWPRFSSYAGASVISFLLLSSCLCSPSSFDPTEVAHTDNIVPSLWIYNGPTMSTLASRLLLSCSCRNLKASGRWGVWIPAHFGPLRLISIRRWGGPKGRWELGLCDREVGLDGGKPYDNSLCILRRAGYSIFLSARPSVTTLRTLFSPFNPCLSMSQLFYGGA